jgi:cytoskeleton protein RodZ
MVFIGSHSGPAGSGRQAKLGGGPLGPAAGAIVAIGTPVTEVSAHLRAARERAGLTIQEVSASTKIRAASIEAMERGNFTALPGEFYTRAFLRTYAAHLGLSPEAILQEYESDPPQAQPSPRGPAPASHVRTAADAASESSSPPPWAYVTAVLTHPTVAIALVAVLLVLAVVKSRPAATVPPPPEAVGTTGTTPPATAPAAAGAPRHDAAETLKMEIQAETAVWITGAADGERVLYRLLAPGERVRLEARKQFAFRIGNAAALTYSINGVPGKPLGASGEVRDVEITRENYRSFAR